MSVIDLPALTQSDQRIVLTGTLHKSSGMLGMDVLRITTNERCSPRWIRFDGFRIKDRAQLEDLVFPTYDNYDWSGIDMADLRNKYYKASRANTNLEYCARLCMHGTGQEEIRRTLTKDTNTVLCCLFLGCDMFEYDHSIKYCSFYPHLALKSAVFPDVANREADPDAVDVAVYVLKCSTAQENVLDGNEFVTQTVKKMLGRIVCSKSCVFAS